MIVVRIVRGVTDHFPMRVADWFLSSMLTNFGLVLLQPQDTFQLSPIYGYMADVATEYHWGLICTFIGVCRLLALTVNGTFPTFRWSPHIRFTCATLTCLVWFQIALGIELSELPSTGLAIYRYLLLFDIFNAFLAASEAGITERKRREIDGSDT